MTKITKLSNLELGLYQDAAREGMTLSQYLNEMGRKGDIAEELFQPNAKNSQGEPVDAFKQLLAAAGIRTKGEFAQTGDAFLSDPTNRVLFPEFIVREYRDAERDAVNVLQTSDLVSTRLGIQNNTYRTGVIQAGQEKDLEFGRVSELGELPAYTIKLSDKAVNAQKYGGVLRMSYESVRRARLPIISRYVAKISRAQNRRKTKQALNTALNGDGNSNPAPASTAATGTTFTLQDIIALQMDGLVNGVQFGIITADAADLAAILNLDIFTGVAATAAGADFRDTGKWPNILGMQPKMAMTDSALQGSKKLLGIDQTNGLEEFYEEGSEIVESEKLITSQFEIIAISEVVGWAKPDTQAFRTKAHA
ncbi:hypothetical protein GO986_16170 [Deinococcus sp. HMF7620]|uniref:Phage major capsid protein n=1 Tax=Deinococcus arboris TaxID=2682977 RepID=A0A7C9M3G9_9DEIO|nr:hypothetical protein [Deinococcus arboris]MVN88282.1 hypothetical protein [Deinococcus arboris]